MHECSTWNIFSRSTSQDGRDPARLMFHVEHSPPDPIHFPFTASSHPDTFIVFRL